MRKKNGLAGRLLVLLAIILTAGTIVPHLAADAREPGTELPKDDRVPVVTVQAASGATIGFTTQNGQKIEDVPPQTVELPHLVLYRDGELTQPDERTLIVALRALPVPASGITATLSLQTYHGDPDLGEGLENRITVWHESKWLGDDSDLDGTVGTIVFEHEFGATIETGTGTVAMPTDYFRYDLTVVGQQGTPASGRLYAFSQDFAFLLENQWHHSLAREQVAAEKAGLEELVVYYCDMFVFQRDLEDPTSRLRRSEIPRYVHRALVPAMLEAFRVQTEDWGFAWKQSWTSYRTEDGRERLSVALSDGETWFHGEAPMRGHSAISLTTKGGANRDYETLTDGLLSTFHHELFHNLQKGMVQEFGGQGDVDGEEDAWRFFAEGTAVLAESIAQAPAEFVLTSGPRTYISHANGFIGRTEFHSELNSSYGKVTPYHAAIYWRFLYEQCGGMKDGIEDPAAGMRVIRRVLEELYANAARHSIQPRDLAHTLPAIMDHVLNDPAARLCPFRTFRESLRRFARAIYQLRLEGGRCHAQGVPVGCGFYDPNNLYVNPPASTITYSGERIVFEAADQLYPRGIRSSFGIDFVEVELATGADGQALAVTFSGDPGGRAEFGIEIWELIGTGTLDRGQMTLVQVDSSAPLPTKAMGRHLSFYIPDIDIGKASRLILIITRLDSEEDSDPVGAYSIVLQPARSP